MRTLLLILCITFFAVEAEAKMNRYGATLKLPNGGLEKVEVEASSWNHAKQMLEMKYGKGNVQNVHQKN